MNGYILLSRNITQSDIWNKPPLYMKVWIYLLTNARFKDGNGLKKGQLKTSIPEIQKACSYTVGYRTETPTQKQIRGVLDWLRNPHEGEHEGEDKGTMIVTTKGTNGILVTICNFNDYQDPKFYEGHNEWHNEIRTKGNTNRQQGAQLLKKHGKKKEKKEEYIYISPFLGEFENVKLTSEQLEKLMDRFPSDYKDRIERLSSYMASKGKAYKSHYATILSWAKKDEETATKGRNDFLK